MARRKRTKEEKKKRRNKLLAGTAIGAGLIGGSVAIAKTGNKPGLSNIKSTGAAKASRPNPPRQKALAAQKSREVYGPREPFGPRMPKNMAKKSGLREAYGPRESFGPRTPKKISKRLDTIHRRERGLARLSPAAKNRLANKYSYDISKGSFFPQASKSQRKKRWVRKDLKSVGRFTRFLGSAMFA